MGRDMTRLQDLYESGGQSPWLDNLKRSYLTSGRLAELVAAGVRGLTSNPTIMAKAIAASADYDEEFSSALAAGQSVEEAYWDLVIADVSGALAVLRAVFDDSAGGDGFVSIEVSPLLAHDTARTIEAARQLHERIDQPNLLVKIPATREGLGAIRALIAEGRSINVTLIFSLERYREVIEAYLSGLEELVAHGGDASEVASVASFFVSRVDTEVDRRLEADRQGGCGLTERHAGSWPCAARPPSPRPGSPTRCTSSCSRGPVGRRWQRREPARNARFGPPPPRRTPPIPTWCTSTPSSPTTPSTPCRRTRSSTTWTTGVSSRSPRPTLPASEASFKSLAECGIDLADVAAVLETEGVAAFAASFDDLLDKLHEKAEAVGTTR